jgi:hypothetical protein
MKKLSLGDRIVIHCVLFIIEGVQKSCTCFYNFEADHFIEKVKQLLEESKNEN